MPWSRDAQGLARPPGQVRARFVRFNGAVTFSERISSFRDRAPRRTASLIFSLLVLVLAFDGTRLYAARDRLTSTEWSHGARSGLIAGALLLVTARVLWLAARRYARASRTIEIVAAVMGVLLFGVTHPRYADDVVSDWQSLTLLVAVDLLFTAVLTYAAIYRWMRSPIANSE